MTEYKFESPDKLDEEQAKALEKAGFVVLKRQDNENLAIWTFDPKMHKRLEKKSFKV